MRSSACCGARSSAWNGCGRIESGDEVAGDDGSSRAFAPSVPTISVAGRNEQSLAQGLVDLVIREDTHGLYRCEARVGNWGPKDGGTGFLYFDRKVLEFGKTFQVKLGNGTLFDGRIT